MLIFVGLRLIMKVLLVIAAFVVAASAISIPDAEVQSQFESFKLEHGKTYADEVEESYRALIFKENLIRIAKHNERYNKGEVSFTVGVNKFADMHLHEMVEARNGFRPELKKPSPLVHEVDENEPWPDWWPWNKKVDWRNKGYVTPVKDQGQCGSCWAFSATGSLEGQVFKKTGKLPSLSEQNIVDCVKDNPNYELYGCGGGTIDVAFQYIKNNAGIDSEASYPYTAQDGDCAFVKANIAGTSTGYVDVKPTEDDLAHAVKNVGPVSVGIDASLWSFNMYSGGIYDDYQCGNNVDSIDHAVLAVGYGNDYWLVKNSWGSKWGEEGYIRIARNHNNRCAIASQASYPIA